MRHLLGELYADKIYLEKLLKGTGKKRGPSFFVSLLLLNFKGVSKFTFDDFFIHFRRKNCRESPDEHRDPESGDPRTQILRHQDGLLEATETFISSI